MSGWRTFRAKLQARPWAALGGLVVDYLTFVAMVVFFALVWALRWPLWLLERITGRSVRHSIVRAVAKLAHG
jgi:hypothetical protein